MTASLHAEMPLWLRALTRCRHRLVVLVATCLTFVIFAKSSLQAQNNHRASLVRAQSQYFSAPDSPSLSITGDLTIEAWVKLRSLPGGPQVILSQGDWAAPSTVSYGLFIYDDAGTKRIVGTVFTGSRERSQAYTLGAVAGQWTHVAFTRVTSSGTFSVYVNGLLLGTSVDGASLAPNDSAAPLMIGARRISTITDHLDGDLDDVRVWSVARTQEQIRATMFAELNGTEAGLRAYWKLNNSLADSSPNGNSLTAINAPTFATNDLPFASSSQQLEWASDKDSKALWHFNGNAIDSSATSNSGTANAVTFNTGSGRFGEGAGFNGTSSHVEMAFVPIVGTDISMSFGCWFKTSSAARQSLIEFGDLNTSKDFPQLQIGAVAPGQLAFDFGGFVGVRPSATFNDGLWHFVVATVNGGNTVRLYVDGVEYGSNTTTGLRVGNTGTVYKQIGRALGGVNYFNGSIDEVFVTSRVLSAEEIMKYYGGIVSARFGMSVDGFIGATGTFETSSAQRSANGNFVSQTTADYTLCALQSNAASQFTGHVRGLFVVATEGLPDIGIAISHATLNVYGSGKQVGFTPQELAVTGASTVSDTTLTATDGDLTDFGEAVLSSYLSYSDFNNTGYNALAFNVAGQNYISATGKTKLAVRLRFDIENTPIAPAPFQNHFYNIRYQESSTPPYLLVEYQHPLVFFVTGTISAINQPTGVIRIAATPVATGTAGGSTLAAPGAYSIAGLTSGATFNITAYVDADGDNVMGPLEWFGSYAGNPLLLDGDKSGINITITAPPDTDNDGLPDPWEVANGLVVGVNDAALDKDGDGLSNAQELWLGLNPNSVDSDFDGLSDFAEVNLWGTNPLVADSDGDGLPDKWETDNGLDPRRDDADEDHDFDFVSNRDEYNGGVNSTNPSSGDSDGNGVSDFVQRNGGQSTWQALYDRNDRLLGTRDARGASFAYRYDANGNPIKQAKLGFDSDGDGLSDLWEFANGLDPSSPNGSNGKTGDADGDGWTNLQEQLAGSDPNDANSRPGANGTVIGALSVPFTPSNFISASGQLDNAGSEEFVVGADGNPGTQTNFIRLFKETGGSWTSEPVNVGSYGVTSAAIGQFPNRRAAIYLGLRKPGGTGRVVELVKDYTGVWQPIVVAESTSEAAYVMGLRTTTTGTDLIFTTSTRIGPADALYRAAFDGINWDTSLVETTASRPTAGVIVKGLNSDGSDSAVRLLNAGGIQFAAPKADVSVDEFNDTVFNSPLWVFSGAAASESGGLGKLEVSWGSGGSASSSAETNLAWSAVGAALEIRVAYAEHLQVGTSFGGEASVRIGGTQIYSGGQNRTESAVDLQVVRGASLAFYRKRVNNGAWTDWGQAALGTLRLEVSGSDVGSYSYSGTAKLHVDYVRYRSPTALLAAGGTANDLGSADIAYRAATNTLYFKTASSQSWLNSQLSAFASGGKLVALDASDVSAWVQGKFGGEYWIGYYRDFSTNPWRWLSRGNGAFTSWLAGQPAGGADQLFAFSNAGVWSSATGAEAKFGVFEVKAPITAVTATTETEPPATNRLQPAGRNLTLGRLNSSSASQQSLVEAFIEDTAPLGVVNAGDKFVLAELVLGASPLVQRTLSQRTLTAATLANNYGLAAVRSRAGTSDFLVTAENDGQVFAWLPATPGAALQRKTLSTEHVGKAWHSLERVPMAGGADALIGLRVTPGAPQTADVVFWSPYDLGFTTPPIIQQSLPTARIASSPALGGANSIVGVTIWDSEGNPSHVALQYQNPAGTGNWTDATLLTVDSLPASGNPLVSALPAGVLHQVVWDAKHDLGAGVNRGVLLRARGGDATSSGAWSEPMFYTVKTNSIIVPPGGALTITGGGTFDSIVIGAGGRLTFGQSPASPAPSIAAATASSIEITVTAQVNPADNRSYLTVIYRRRTDMPKLVYTIETTTDLTTWTNAGADAELIGVVPDVSNFELVKVRIHPSIGTPGTPAKYVRVRVSSP